MQEDSIHLTARFTGVLLLPLERMPCQCELNPNLVLDPGLEDDLQQGAVSVAFHHEPVQDRLLSLAGRHGIHSVVPCVLG